MSNAIERWDPTWPDSSRSSAMLSFDVDGLLLWADKDQPINYRQIGRAVSLGNYGLECGLPRILDMLDRTGVSATFFIPTFNVEHWPELAKRIVDSGHEIGLHGHLHESFYPLAPHEQSEIIDRSQEILERVIGKRASGFRSPSGDWSSTTAKLLADHGLLYSSSYRGDDRPFRWKFQDGSSLVEISGHWELDDFPQFAFNDVPARPISQDRPASTKATFENWEWEFDGYLREGLSWVLIMHPQVTGTPHRVAALESLIRRIQEEGDVWFATGAEIANWVNTNLDSTPGRMDVEK